MKPPGFWGCQNSKNVFCLLRLLAFFEASRGWAPSGVAIPAGGGVLHSTKGGVPPFLPFGAGNPGTELRKQKGHQGTDNLESLTCSLIASRSTAAQPIRRPLRQYCSSTRCRSDSRLGMPSTIYVIDLSDEAMRDDPQGDAPALAPLIAKVRVNHPAMCTVIYGFITLSLLAAAQCAALAIWGLRSSLPGGGAKLRPPTLLRVEGAQRRVRRVALRA